MQYHLSLSQIIIIIVFIRKGVPTYHEAKQLTFNGMGIKFSLVSGLYFLLLLHVVRIYLYSFLSELPGSMLTS